MARLAVIALLIGLLSACGKEPADVAADPTPAEKTMEQPTGRREAPNPAPGPDRKRRPYVPPLVEDPKAPVAEDLERLTAAFVRYAVAEADTFPYAESVTFSLGGQVVQAVDDIVAALPNRDIWSACPADWVGSAAAGCPVDYLGPIGNAVANRHRLVLTSELEEVTCAPTRLGPPPGGRLVVIRPEPEWRSCAYDFAIVLAADEKGRLTGIDLTLAEP